MFDQKPFENVKYILYLGSLIANEAIYIYICEIKFRVVIVKRNFQKCGSFGLYIGLRFKEEISDLLHVEYRFCGVENWVL